MRYVIPRERDGSLSATMVSRHDDDGSVAFIPLVEGSADAATFQKWQDEGNEPDLAPAPPFDSGAVKAECGRRIYSVASDNAQKNMLATIIAGGMSDAERETFRVGVAWIAAMQAACRDLIVATDPDFAADAKWPPIPAGVAELAARF